MIRRPKRLFKIALILFLFVLAGALYFSPQTFLCVDSGPVKADVIVVLGGGGTQEHERPIRAAELFHQHAASWILVSGAGDDQINRRILMKLGVPATNILLESESATTRENAKDSIAILNSDKVHSAIIVTSWYHSRRALKTFEHFGPGIQFYVRPSYYFYQRSTWSHEFFRHVYWEYIKLPGYWFGYGVFPW
jgi:uncharacterized SAM-binding protein YcdF (DUF218 family)